MSGNIAALAGYTGSGTQGLCVVDTVKGNPEDVVSTVWTKDDNTKQLITGTNVVELESSSGKNTFGGIVNFTVPGSDTDIIGGMLLTYDIMISTAASKQSAADSDLYENVHTGVYSVPFKTSVINKIEILVGSQVWQTISSQDILSVQTIFGVSTDMEHTLGTENPKVRVSLKLPSFSKSINKNNNGYIMSCAPHQDFHVKVYFNKIDKFKQSLFHSYTDTLDSSESSRTSPLTNYIEDLDNVKLYLEYTMLSNYERNMLSNITIPKKVFYTQSITHKTNFKETTIPVHSSQDFNSNIVSPKISINCDSFSLFCSGLIINLGVITDFKTRHDFWRGYKNITATLYLNNTRYSAPISMLQNMMFPDLEHYDPEQDNIFINLSNTPMGCGVPFNRYDNIRIEIEVENLVFSHNVNKPRTSIDSGLIYSGDNTLSSISADPADYISEFNRFMNSRPITVTAVGYTTVLYNGGASSITTY